MVFHCGPFFCSLVSLGTSGPTLSFGIGGPTGIGRPVHRRHSYKPFRGPMRKLIFSRLSLRSCPILPVMRLIRLPSVPLSIFCVLISWRNRVSRRQKKNRAQSALSVLLFIYGHLLVGFSAACLLLPPVRRRPQTIFRLILISSTAGKVRRVQDL